MIEKRYYKILNKIIRSQNIRGLATQFGEITNNYINLYTASNPEHKKYIDIKFLIKTNDRVEYSSNELEIFKEEGIIDTKRPVEIQMDFRDYNKKTYLKIDLIDSQLSYGDSEITIEGSDSTWINGTFYRLLEYINSWENQKTVVKKYRWLIALPLTWLIAWTIIAIGIFILNLFKYASISIFSPYLLICSLGFSGFGFVVAQYIENLYPSIEIVPVPENEQKLIRKRRSIWFLLTFIIIPFIIAIIAGLVIK